MPVISDSNGARNDVTVTLPGPFTSNTRFRFRADASEDDDQVYIDNVVISGCQSTQFSSEGGNDGHVPAIDQATALPAADIVELQSGPNPVSDSYRMEFMARADISLDYMIVDMTGRVLLQDRLNVQEGHNLLTIDVRDLTEGTYFLSVGTGQSRFTKKLIVARGN